MTNNVDIITAAEVMIQGLLFMGFSRETQQTMVHNRLLDEFRSHYGCLPVDLAKMWYDLQVTEVPGVALTENEKDSKSFAMFMAANYFIWTHPKNARLMASRFGFNIREIHSQSFWKWVEKIGALNEDKICWDDRFGDDNYATMQFLLRQWMALILMYGKNLPSDIISTKV